MYAAVGFGANSPVKIIARVLQEYRKEHQEINVEEKIQELSKDQKDRKARAAAASSGVVVKGIEIEYVSSFKLSFLHKLKFIGILAALLLVKNAVIPLSFIHVKTKGYGFDLILI